MIDSTSEENKDIYTDVDCGEWAQLRTSEAAIDEIRPQLIANERQIPDTLGEHKHKEYLKQVTIFSCQACNPSRSYDGNSIYEIVMLANRAMEKKETRSSKR